MSEVQQDKIRNELEDPRLRVLLGEVVQKIRTRVPAIEATVTDSWQRIPQGDKARDALESGKEPALTVGYRVFVNPSHPEMSASEEARFVMAHELGHVLRRQTGNCITLRTRADEEDFRVDRLVFRWGFAVPRGRSTMIGASQEQYIQLLADEDEERAIGRFQDFVDRAILEM